jgi:outer membrane lipoprotein SlyB
MRSKIVRWSALLFILGVTGCSTPMTTRETGAVMGTVGGAAVGGIVGSAVGHPGAGAAVGGVVGLGGGALIGDQIQALQNRQSELDKQLKASEAELESQRKELERLKKESKEY